MNTSGDLQAGWEALSRTEKKVIGLVQKGLTNPEIAAHLYVSPRTVQTHLYNVFKKVGVKSRQELAREAAARNLAAELGWNTSN